MTDVDVAPTGSRVATTLVGHEDGERILCRAWNDGRLPHAWLFAGPEGIGKATLAFRFARFVLAQGAPSKLPGTDSLFGPTNQPPPVTDLAIAPDHPVFRHVANGAHPDLLVLSREKLGGTIAVDQVRQIGRFLRLTSALGGWRVVIVDGAETMNRNAANALLKNLEEPPERTLLILVSHAPGRLVATLRSRCRRLTLAPLAADQVHRLLQQHSSDLDRAQVTALTELAGGSPGHALALLQAGGLELQATIASLLDGLPTLDWAIVQGLGDQLARQGQEAAFAAFSETLLSAIASRARQQADRSSGDRMRLADWLAVWDKTRQCLGPVQPLNLERKQAVITAFGGIAETVARP